MGNISQKDKEFIESQISTNSSKVNQQMKEEYLFLTNTIRRNGSNLKQFSSLQKSKKNSSYSILNPIKITKRMERFVKWFKMIYGNENNFTLKGQEFNYEKNLIKYKQNNSEHFISRVLKGCPDSLRCLTWKIISNLPEDLNEDLFNYYVSLPIDSESDIQIKKDLERTFVDNDLEIENNNKNINEEYRHEESLYKVLRALANIDKDMSYCQGINFIAGFLLKISEFDELWTFYMLISLFSDTYKKGINLRGFFIDGFPLLELFVYYFDELLKEEYPELYTKIEEFGLPKEAWINKWIHCLFTVYLPFDINIRLWDYLLGTDLRFIICFSLTILEYTQKDILNLTDGVEFLEFFRNLFSKKDVVYDGLEYSKSNSKDISINDILEDSFKKYENFLKKNTFTSLQKEYFKRENKNEYYILKYKMEYEPREIILPNDNCNPYIEVEETEENLEEIKEEEVKKLSSTQDNIEDNIETTSNNFNLGLFKETDTSIKIENALEEEIIKEKENSEIKKNFSDFDESLKIQVNEDITEITKPYTFSLSSNSIQSLNN